MKKRLEKLILCGLFAAVLAVLSQLALPMPMGIPFTLQTFGVSLCAYVLGLPYGFFSYLIYFLMGLCGVPVFSNFTGGLGKMMGPTGGFLVGFFLLSLGCGFSSFFWSKRRSWTADSNQTMEKQNRFSIVINWIFCFLLSLFGLFCSHLIGILWICKQAGISLTESFLTFSFPFLWKDILSVLAARFCSRTLRRVCFRGNEL